MLTTHSNPRTILMKTLSQTSQVLGPKSNKQAVELGLEPVCLPPPKLLILEMAVPVPYAAIVRSVTNSFGVTEGGGGAETPLVAGFPVPGGAVCPCPRLPQNSWTLLSRSVQQVFLLPPTSLFCRRIRSCRRTFLPYLIVSWGDDVVFFQLSPGAIS